MTFFRENGILILVIAVLAGGMLIGHRKGFVRVSGPLVSLVATVILFRLLCPGLLRWLETSELIRGISGKLAEKLRTTDPDTEAELLMRFFGLDVLSSNFGTAVRTAVIKVLGFIALYLVVYLLMKLVLAAANVTAKLPVISGLNQIAGALLGTALALFYVWIFMMIVSTFSYQSWAAFVLERIRASAFLSFLYRSNLLMMFLRGVLKVVI